MTPTDLEILKFLRQRKSKNADLFVGFLATSLMELREQIILYVRAFKELRDVDEFVDDVIIEILEDLRLQFMTGECKMPFTDRHADRVEDLLKGYIFAKIGRPFQGVHSGMITNAIRKERTADKNLKPYDEDFLTASVCGGDDDERFDIENAEERAYAALDTMKPKKAFVVRAYFGLHEHEGLTPEALQSIAQETQLDPKECKFVKVMASELIEVSNDRAPKSLNQVTTGKLVALKDRQVRNILSEFEALLAA